MSIQKIKLSLSETSLSQFADAMARLQPTGHLACILDMGRAHVSAKTCRDVAWEMGEASALIAKILTQTLENPKHVREIVESAKEALISALDKGTSELSEVIDGLDMLWAITIGIGRDAIHGEEISFLREGLEAGTTFVALGEGNPRIRDYMRLDALIAQLQEIQAECDPVRQGTLLLRLHFLAAGSDAPEFRQTRSLVDLAGQGGGGALLPLVLHRVDRAHVSGIGDDDAISYLTYLSQHPTDRNERSEFMLRLLAISNEIEDSETLRTLANSMPSHFSRSEELIERACRYVQAMQDENYEDAALIATDHGNTTTDTALAVAWHTRALMLQRRACAERDVLKRTIHALNDAVTDHTPFVPAVAALANDVLLAIMLREGDFEEVKTFLHSSFQQDKVTRLRVLMCGSETPLDQLRCAVRSSCDNSTLISVLAIRAEPAEEASRLLEEAIKNRSSNTRQVLRELKLYLDLFRCYRFEQVLHDASVLLVEPNSPIIALWAAWIAANHLDRLQEFIPKWQRMLRRVSGELKLHFYAAIAESFVALKMPEHAEPFLEALPDELWREAIRGRLRQLQPEATATGSWAVVSTVTKALINEPRLLKQMHLGRVRLKAHQWGEAAAAFGELGQLVKRKEDRYRLFIVAGRSSELDPDMPNAAEGFYQRAIEQDHTKSEAWDRLLTLLVRKRDLKKVAILCKDSRGQIGKLQTMHLLLKAAKTMSSISATQAFDIYRFLLLSMPLTQTKIDTSMFFEGAFSTADKSKRLEELHALFQRLILKHANSALLPRLDEWTLIVRERLGFETDLLSLMETARDHGCKIEQLERIEQSYLRRQGISAFLYAMDDLAATAADSLTHNRIFWFASQAADRADDPLSAVRLCHKIIKRSPRFYKAHLRLAEHFQTQKKWRKTVSHFEAAARLIRNTALRADVYYMLGDIYTSELKEPALALESFLVSFICDSGRAETLERLEMLYTEMGRYRDLAGSYEIALQHAIQQPEKSTLNLQELYIEKARIELQNLRNPQRAAETLYQAITLNPEEENYLHLLINGIGDAGGKTLIKSALKKHLATLSPEKQEKIKARPRWNQYIENKI